MTARRAYSNSACMRDSNAMRLIWTYEKMKISSNIRKEYHTKQIENNSLDILKPYLFRVSEMLETVEVVILSGLPGETNNLERKQRFLSSKQTVS